MQEMKYAFVDLPPTVFSLNSVVRLCNVYIYIYIHIIIN